MDFKKRRETLSKFMLIWGTIGSMPIINFLSITAYVWCLMVVPFVVAYHYSGHIKLYRWRVEPNFLILIILMMISYLICGMRMPNEWTHGLTTSFIQFLFFIFTYYIFATSCNVKYLSYFVKGVYYSSIIQMVWCYIQFGMYKINIDINNIVFRDILHLINESASQFQYGTIKLSGMCWNSGNIAPLFLFGFVYTKDVRIKILFLIISFLSGSRTLMIGMIVCMSITVLQYLKSIKKEKRKTLAKAFLSLIGVTLVIIPIIVMNWNSLSIYIEDILNRLNILENVNSEGSSSVHLGYYMKYFDIVRKNSLIVNLFGFGPECSGYPYSTYFNQYTDIIGAWRVESDFMNRLWAYGHVGFLAYYYWYLKNAFCCIKVDGRFLPLFVSLLIEGITYNVTFNWTFLLIVSIFILNRFNYSAFEDVDSVGYLNYFNRLLKTKQHSVINGS